MAFHMGLHCLPKYLFKIQRVKPKNTYTELGSNFPSPVLYSLTFNIYCDFLPYIFVHLVII